MTNNEIEQLKTEVQGLLPDTVVSVNYTDYNPSNVTMVFERDGTYAACCFPRISEVKVTADLIADRVNFKFANYQKSDD